MHRNALRLVSTLALILGIGTLGCEEDPADTTISQFDRPQDVAFVCIDYNNENGPSPVRLDYCGKNGLLSGALYAFVTQTTPGEVAVVELPTATVMDQEKRIPYTTYIPVGGQPSDIAATLDGKKVITANYETGDLTVINVDENGTAIINNPTLNPSYAVDIGGAAGRMALAVAPGEDHQTSPERFAFVTQPGLGRLAVVALHKEDCPNEESSPNGCLLGWMVLDADKNDGEDLDDRFPGGIKSPWSITIPDNKKDSIYVSGYDSAVIKKIATESLIIEALSLEKPGKLSHSSVVQEIHAVDSSGEEYKIRAMAISYPWLYAIEADNGYVLAIDLNVRDENDPDREPDVIENGVIKTIELNGRALAVEMAQLAELTEIDTGAETDTDTIKNDPTDPLTFNGLFAVVSTTNARITVIDVEDKNANKDYGRPHSIRSAVYLFPEDTDTETEGIPRLVEKPVLYNGADKVLEENAVDYVYFQEPDAGSDTDTADTDTSMDSGVEISTDTDSAIGDSLDAGTDFDDFSLVELPVCSLDAGVEYRPKYDYGFRFRCDPYATTREEWRLSWEGSIGISGVGVLTDDLGVFGFSTTDDLSNRPWYLFDQDKGMDYCKRGLYTSKTLGPGEYPGDLLVITSKPTAVTKEAQKACEETYGETPELIFRVVSVLNYPETESANVLRIEDGIDTNSTLPLSPQCFDQAVTYEIRASGHWVLYGISSRYRYDRGKFVADTDTDTDTATDAKAIISGKCDYGYEKFEDRLTSRMRVWPGEQFENGNFTFKLQNGPLWDSLVKDNDTDTDTETDSDTSMSIDDWLYFAFQTTGGFMELSSEQGNNITALKFAPNTDLILIDQASDSLIIFDMIDGFSQKGLVD